MRTNYIANYEAFHLFSPQLKLVNEGSGIDGFISLGSIILPDLSYSRTESALLNPNRIITKVIVD